MTSSLIEIISKSNNRTLPVFFLFQINLFNAIRDTDPCAGGIFNSGSQQSPNTQINNDKTTTAMTSRSNHHGARAPSNSPYPNAFVKITEQPAPKALRFRYECEGRSAGSIPGASSTPDNKTYPGIQVVNYRGRAVVVVSCVTKDKPYRAHPHKLVGKDICSKGVCTLEINNETMTATFANLGIQCVKKKDIEESLKEREKIRVDPFRKGFGHASQPSSIDLNAVRLCFQVFLKDPDGHNFNIPLEPVVSEPIYDKKAMSDLVICKLSKPSCNVAGGDEIILLCEKVAKEDIQVRFFEENQGVIVWEGYGDFQHTNVHKQVAISFRTPKYKTLDIEQPVKCFIQLRRPSDNATSDALPFEYLPLDSGRRSLIELRKGLKVKGNFEALSRYFTSDGYIDPTKIANGISVDADVDDGCVQRKKPCVENYLKEAIIVDDINMVDSTEKTSEWLEKTEFSILNDELATAADTPLTNNTFDYDTVTASPVVSRIEDCRNMLAQSENSGEEDEDKTLNELLEQVAELDEIYSGYQMKRNVKLEETKQGYGNDMSFDFDDTATYTSLQRAFKNPIPISDPDPQPRSYNVDYDTVEPIINPLAPVIDISPVRRIENVVEEEKLPPLPPKRLRKITAENTEYNANLLPPSPSIKEPNNDSDEPQIIIKRSPDSRSPASSTNNSAQSSPQKKQGFFSRIFRRKSKCDIGSNCNTDTKNSPNLSRESSFNNFEGFDRNRLSTRSFRTPQSPSKKSKPVGRSVSSVSGKRPHLTADVVHIPLKGLSSDSLPMRSGSGNIIMPEHYSSNFTLSNNLDRKTVSALQLADIPIQDGNMELVAIADAQSLRNLCEGQYGVKLDADVDLSEAEHFALYTSVAPTATQSEFDDMSAFYAPVEAAEVVPNTEIAKRLAMNYQTKD
ncbi:embryonic polarity protein dorsal-like isoform X2 [Sitodiplosis mosellana]|uniref:embryonic polarity protein dorsal-like isoform X2 n=1 Tax=Sitodiplosis mosellana TaxID=263140 RepID=UPI0024451977|nr:embryonic polarity protein dorsal-like isoform X2 [Sitodiplosis mosellana]